MKKRYQGLFGVLTSLCLLLALPGVIQAQSDEANTPITLPVLLVPTEGMTASYVITQVAQQLISEVSGLFSLVPMGDVEQDQIGAVGVRYTVLERDEDATTARVWVEAQALDPTTHEALRGLRWEAVYLLDADGVEWEEGHQIPDDYLALVKPDWLADWTITDVTELPQEPLEPGSSWASFAHDLGAEFPFGEIDLPVTGTFVGWQPVTDGTHDAAVIHERMTGSATMVDEESLGMPAELALHVDAYAESWLLPEDFPHLVEQRVTGDMVVSVDLQGLPGGMALDLLFERIITRVDDETAAAWFLPYDDLEIDVSQSVSGSLGSWSYQLSDGTAYDIYHFFGYEGERISFLLESTEFDAYLIIVDDAFMALAEDDNSAGDNDALITMTLPYTGSYFVIANSYEVENTGAYTLTVDFAVEEEIVIDYERASWLVARLATPDVLSDEELAEAEATLADLLVLVRRYRSGS